MIGRLRVVGVPERVTRRLAAVVLGFESFVVVFGALVAWAQARAAGEDGARGLLLGGLGLAVVTILASGMLRRPWGITLGWLIQLTVLAGALVVPAMLLAGGLFLGLWVAALVQGERMDQLTRDHVHRQEDPA